jgi:peptide chain release factor 1
MRDLLEQKLARFEQLEKDLVDPEVLSKPARITAVAREHGSLARLANKYRRFKKICAQVDEAQQMIDGSDAEMRELAEGNYHRCVWDGADLEQIAESTIGGETPIGRG